jgi:hypothetical protein
VKSHRFGYRIGQFEDSVAFRPGGLLSLGCSFTYGDEVDAGLTFTQQAANSLNIPAYNYGICSFSYTHALLKAQELQEQGILDELKPEYVVLGCWSGLPARSRSPFPPLVSKSIPLPAAYMVKEGSEVGIQYPMKVQDVFDMVEMYRKEGPGFNARKFARIYTSVPRYLYLYTKNNRLAQEIKYRTFQNNVPDKEIYDFYFTGIEKVFSGYGSRIIVLFMPNSFDNEQPDDALKEAVAGHPGIILVNGLDAIREFGVSGSDYVGKHPRPPAHKAYAEGIVRAIGKF